MTHEQPYTVALTRSARRALAEELPLDVTMSVTDFIAGPLVTNPHRVGKPLDKPLQGRYAARVMREWRLLYTIDEERRAITVRSIRHRRDAYRTQ